MNKIISIFTLLISFQAFADKYEHGELIIGHFWFDNKMNSEQVADLGKQILKDDSNFNSMTVVGTGPHEWGLYFRYNKSEKMKTNAEFSKFYQDKIKKTASVHRFGISASDGVIILK